MRSRVANRQIKDLYSLPVSETSFPLIMPRCARCGGAYYRTARSPMTRMVPCQPTCNPNLEILREIRIGRQESRIPTGTWT